MRVLLGPLAAGWRSPRCPWRVPARSLPPARCSRRLLAAAPARPCRLLAPALPAVPARSCRPLPASGVRRAAGAGVGSALGAGGLGAAGARGVAALIWLATSIVAPQALHLADAALKSAGSRYLAPQLAQTMGTGAAVM